MTTKKSYYSLIEAILEAPVIAIDYETMSNSAGKYKNMEYWHEHSRLVSGSFTTPEATFVVPLSHPEGPWSNNWRKLITNVCKAMHQNERLKWVAHNAKYEATWMFWMTGYTLEDKMWWDTMMSSYTLDENETHNLKDVAVRELGVEPWADVDLRNSEKVPWDSLALYNARDTDYCYRVRDVHKERLENEPRLARLFHFLSMPIIRTLTRIERTGMALDQTKVSERKVRAEQVVEDGTDDLMHLARELGLDLDEYPTVSFGTTNKFFKAFMEASGLPVVSYTDTGNPSWDQFNLEHLVREGHEVASKVLEVRRASSKISKFFVPWTNNLASDGRIHATFNPMRVDDKWSATKGTKTGRLSSSNVNMQQVARDEKECFGGESGWLEVELDYSQIELRILAWLSNSKQPLKAYRNNEDLHTLMAARVLSVSPSEVDGEGRQKGKAGNFGFSYGMGEATYIDYAYKNYNVRVDMEEARKTRKEFFNFWDGLDRYHHRQGVLAFKYGYVRNPIGRKRRLPEVYSSQNHLVGQAERRAINSPTQSFASDLMCLALIEIDRTLDPKLFRLVGTVHDSLLAQVRPEAADTLVPRAAAIMLDPGVKKKFGVSVEVPLAVDAKIAYHWNSADARTMTFQ